MRNGILLSNNFDAGFIGVRKMPNSSNPGDDDVSDFVINWSDNPGVDPSLRGPDNLVFNFTLGNGSNNDDLSGDSEYGRETMRMNSNGNIGIGPRFSNDHQPKSTFHQHQENSSDSWYQITNQAMTIAGNQTEPTAINATNGLRVGIKGHENQQMNGNALIYNQEKRHLLFSTAHNTDETDIGNGITLERMRISSISAPTNLATGGYGVYNPWGLPTDITRVSISRHPKSPVTRPMSLLHLGHNIGTASAPTSTHGWRRWMDIGMFTSHETEHLYVGLKSEGENKFDAVINWGDGQDEESTDNLRFIFTSTSGGTGDAASQSGHGKEVGRFAPTGEFGVGNFYTNGLNEQPTEMLDVDGTARLRQMPNESPNVLITGVGQDEDPVDGDYVLNYLAFPEDETMFLNGLGEWSALSASDCRWQDINSISVAGEIDIYTGVDPEEDCYRGKVGIGVEYLKSKLGVVNILDRDNSLTGIYSKSMGWGDNMNESIIGVHGVADIFDYSYPLGGSSFINAGVMGEGRGSRYTIGVRGIGHVHPSGNITGYAFGVMGQAATDAMNVSAAIYGEALTPTDYSGYFVGGMFTTTGASVIISDESVKNSIENVENATDILSQLEPKTYYYQSPENREIAFQESLQYGFVAQEVQEILPDIVKEVTIPEKMDSTGFIEGTSANLLGVQYESLIPILVAGFKEQQQTITALEELVNSQNETLAQVMVQMEQLQQQIESCCNTDRTAPSFHPNEETPGVIEKAVNELHQNTPNPFRSQTTISYTLEQQGKVVLKVFDKTGKPITTIVEAEQAVGTYRYEWNASGLPAGLYHYALYVNGELLVKKAIKLAD